ncbi:PH (Pleckstrin Homology) domain-containing protein [Roseimicrobium gellanilyticum]|uniref:PH (Pleckstrin Homology) domain-containing protein n=1 Tax=Roseimicrobium gellanilyticum TaxID=748857 RepID=A0A366HMU0_9BACT|nr:PH domain-containing protein [Roseimicrobium gellanilyticum]RBP44467.1 PH (Pleckstrin Homology) domain-containing protein [Roseimicrobium gellanilyticum]
MANARYFLPDHPTLKDVYSKNDLRAMLISGTLSRSDMVLDDETGHGHLLGDLLAMPYPDVTNMPRRSTSGGGPSPRPQLPPNHEFRADTPLPRPETDFRPPSQRRPAREDNFNNPDEGDEEEEDASFEDDEFAPGLDEDEPDHFDDHGVEDEEELDEDALHLNASAAGSGMPPPVQEWRPGYPNGGMMRPHLGEAETSYPEDREPEEMLYQGHPSWFAYPKSLLGIALTIAGAVVSHHLHFGMEWMLLFSSIAGLVLLFVGLDRYTCTYFITTRRVEMEYGVLGRNTREVRIRDIRAIDVQQSGWRALLGMGNLRFDSSVSAGPEVYFRNVHRPHTLKEMVRELQR